MGGGGTKFTIFVPLDLRMPQTKNGQNWLSGFREEVENVQMLTNDGRRTTDDDGREVIAIGHLSETQVT